MSCGHRSRPFSGMPNSSRRASTSRRDRNLSTPSLASAPTASTYWDSSTRLLDIAKIESGQFTLNMTEYAIESVVETVRAATESLAQNKKLTLTTSVDNSLPIGLGDEQRLTAFATTLRALGGIDRQGHPNISPN